MLRTSLSVPHLADVSLLVQANLQCSVLGSSVALQKSAFRLFARAVCASTGERVTHIREAISDPFVVATQRVKTAQKVLLSLCSESMCNECRKSRYW